MESRTYDAVGSGDGTIPRLVAKWRELLDSADLEMPRLSGEQRNAAAVLLENANGNTENLRRYLPTLVAFDFCGVQPMPESTGLAFALRANEYDGKGELSMTIDKVALQTSRRKLSLKVEMDEASSEYADEIRKIVFDQAVLDLNRETVRAINTAAVDGGDAFDGTAGELVGRIEAEAEAIARATLRGRGNFVIMDENTVDRLDDAGLLEDGVDDRGGIGYGGIGYRGKAGEHGIKVYADPFSGARYATVGYRGGSAYDAGLFYCPHVLLDEETDDEGNIRYATDYQYVENTGARGVGKKRSAGGSSYEYGGSDWAATGANVYYRYFPIGIAP